MDDTKWSFLLRFSNTNFCGPKRKWRVAPTKKQPQWHQVSEESSFLELEREEGQAGATAGAGLGEQRTEPAAHRGPGRCQGRKEVPGGASETLSGAHLAPWATGGKRVPSATRTRATVEGAGVPDSPSSSGLRGHT